MVADTKTEIVAQYVSDMYALETHILKALEAQVSSTTDEPEINRALQGYVTKTTQHIAQLEQAMETAGEKAGLADKVKQGVSAIFGIAAGAIDKVRTHSTAKDLRDDYTAGSLAVIGYVQLRTTALACNDAKVAHTAETLMNDVIEMLQWIARTIPAATVRDLQKERDVQFDMSAVQQVTNDPKLKALYGSTPQDAVTAR